MTLEKILALAEISFDKSILTIFTYSDKIVTMTDLKADSTFSKRRRMGSNSKALNEVIENTVNLLHRYNHNN